MAVSRPSYLSVWLPPVAVATAIFLFSATPDLAISSAAWLDLIVRKIAHLTVFALLGFTVRRAVEETITTRHHVWWAIVAAALYALSDEYHQLSVPGRHGSPLDFGIDIMGVLVGVLVSQIMYQQIQKAAPVRRRLK